MAIPPLQCRSGFLLPELGSPNLRCPHQLWHYGHYISEEDHSHISCPICSSITLTLPHEEAESMYSAPF